MALTATLLILAGGESRRMGQPKPLLPVGSTTLIEWVVARLFLRSINLWWRLGESASCLPACCRTWSPISTPEPAHWRASKPAWRPPPTTSSWQSRATCRTSQPASSSAW